ncbi:hypothetical protein NEOC65_000190 [Neochlamydia sp. AcF65]|nr:hypothetical protein [Neochlamydia sp. AcF65]
MKTKLKILLQLPFLLGRSFCNRLAIKRKSKIIFR